MRLSQEKSIALLLQAIADSTSAADTRFNDLRSRETERLRRLKVSFGKQLVPLTDAVTDSSVLTEALITDLAVAVADSATRSVAELAAIRKRLDQVSKTAATLPEVVAEAARSALTMPNGSTSAAPTTKATRARPAAATAPPLRADRPRLLADQSASKRALSALAGTPPARAPSTQETAGRKVSLRDRASGRPSPPWADTD